MLGMGKLEAIWTKRAHGGPMDARLTATAVPGKGLAGCANNSRTRQVTIIEREIWQELMDRKGATAPPSARRANLMVSGISLADSRGRLLRVGSALLRIGGETKPCERMDEVVEGLQNLMYAGWAGGAFAQVIEGGEISIGDTVKWADAGLLPKAILLDLDDTILNDSGNVDRCWRDACGTGVPECGVAADVLFKAIKKSGNWFWSDPERHRVGRLDLRTARREVARLALMELGILDRELAGKIGDVYHERREQRIEIFPDAIETLGWMRDQGSKLALLTNGNGPSQRRKIEIFGLERFFDAIFIEGEVGFGKPDQRIYRLALNTLGLEPRDAWMAGDNLVWDVLEPQKMGIFAIWIDAGGNGHSKLDSIRPDRVIRKLSDLRHHAPVF